MKILLMISLLICSIASYTAQAEQNSDSNADSDKGCMDDGEVLPLGTKLFVSCATDPSRPETTNVKFCYKNEDGQAIWSQEFSEIDPNGC